ncbi:actin, putative [Entamoeba invadens IP1]|uniref:Actin, putative n=1 Tax=Entamoeba invadens IP1 TaxID=370355 RepID=A0A0A1UAC4_ENTIV|nr:actin, putative [Entamoeba invadens IP1]ELP91987.1 actin, putative [Entamoeba invadens IP1]|eukprot:XP_004258758.1 actin, putative [Entamoeba invadens IP1]
MAVVIDNGSSLTKIGMGECENPKSVIPTIQNGISPVERGLIKNWDTMEQLWHRVFYNELKIKPKEHPLLYIEPVMNPKNDRNKIVQIMFENNKIPSLLMCPSTYSTIIGKDLRCGFCIESGDGVTQIGVMYDGYSMPCIEFKHYFAGNDLTQNFIKRMNGKGYSLNTPEMKKAVENIKETLFYTALDVNDEIKKDVKELEKSYKLPDGKEMIIARKRYGFPEALFNLAVIDITAEGIQEFVSKGIEKLDYDIRNLLASNIVLGGGNTKINGFEARLEKELKNMNSQRPYKFQTYEDPKIAAWIGGSLISQSHFFGERSLTKEEYNEKGEEIITQKFLIQF